jgi:hypothetical protein
MSTSRTFAFDLPQDLNALIGGTGMICDLVYSEITMANGIHRASAMVVIHREDLLKYIRNTIRDMSLDAARQSDLVHDDDVVTISMGIGEAGAALKAVTNTSAQYFYLLP